MTLEELRERGIQILSLVPIVLAAAALTCPATDLEPPWGDAAGETGGPGPGADADDDVEEPDPDAGETGGGGDGGEAAESAPLLPPALVPPACEAYEVASAGVCVVAGLRSASLRFALDRPGAARAACTAGDAETTLDEPLEASSHRLVAAPLPADAAIDCVLWARNAAGEAEVARAVFRTGAAAPWVAITEVLANPLGPEPPQEFVEIANLGEEPVPLAGWRLEDEADGVELPAELVLEPGQFALLVPDGYDSSGAGDPAAAPGARLVRVGRAIGSAGLRNSGEAVFLLDGSGAVVSSYDARLGTLADGVSAERRPPESPEADLSAWAASDEAGPTPGGRGRP